MFIGKTDQIQQFGHAALNFRLWGIIQLQRERYVAEDGARGQQVKVLENHANLATCAGQLFFRQRGQLLTVNQDTAFGRTFQ